jgi:hypothetical protein
MASRRSSNSSEWVDRLIVHRTTDPQWLTLQIQQQLNPFCVQLPILPGDLIDRWCGLEGPADENIARELIDHARQLLPVESESESALERSWQRESAIGHGNVAETIEVARILLAPSDELPIAKLRAGISLLRDKGFTEAELFRKLSSLSGEDTRPILLVVSVPVARWFETIHFLVSAIELAADARLIVILDPLCWDHLRETLDSHTAALLAHALIDTNPPHKPVLRYTEEPDRSPDGPPSPQPIWDETSTQLQHNATRAVKIALSIPAPPKDSAPIPKEYAEARSLAEALLYAALQSNPNTKDLFSLNADGGFWFGSRRAEIDLLCASLRIAIEVDGYFHFQDNNAYRRDRAKDFLMQTEGLLVLRCLAEDVAERLDFVLADIFKAVKLRQKQG